MATETTPAPSASRYRDVFAVREFGPLFAAYVVSLLGDVVAAVALTVLVFERTGSPFLAGLTFTLAFVPSLLGGTLLSALVDRLPPRRLMVGCDLVSASLVAAMAATPAPVWALLAMLALLGLISPLESGARVALLGVILPGDVFVAGRSLFRIVAQSAQVVGNATGGALLVVASPRGALAADAASFAAAALLVRFGTRARGARSPELRGGSVLADSLGGLRAVLATPGLRRVLLLGWLVPAVAVAPEALAAPAVRELGGSTTMVGLWLAALPAGVIAGEVAALWLFSAARRRRFVAPLAVWVFVPLLVFAAEPPLALALPLLVASGLGHGYSLGLDALITDLAADVLRSRVFTVLGAGLMATQGVGFAAAGALAELISPHAAIVVAAGTGLATVAFLAPRPRRGPPSASRGLVAPT